MPPPPFPPNIPRKRSCNAKPGSIIKITIHTPIIITQPHQGITLNAHPIRLSFSDYKGNGWIILNQTKTGGVGSNDVKWTKEACRQEASKYDKVSHFMRKVSGAYKAAAKYGWLDEFFPRTSKNGYWNNKELCRDEAKKYKNRSEFCYSSWAAYNYSNMNNWLDDFYPK